MSRASDSALTPSLSLAVIARDEAARLPALLDDAAKIPGLIQSVVVDTGSRDGTAEVARSHGAEVHDFCWNDDFAAARNAALAQCRGDFILWLDADDRLPPETAAGLRELLCAPAAAWRLVVRSPREDGGGDVFRQIRLFPNRRGLVFEGRIHEQLGTACARLHLPVRETDLEVVHTGYATPEQRAAKACRNLDLLRREMTDHPGDPAVAMALGNALCQTGAPAEALRIFRERLGESPHDPPEHPYLRRFPCLIAECCERLGDAAGAERWDALADSWEPEHLLPALRNAKRALGRGRFKGALTIFLSIAHRPAGVGLLAADNASVRRNALGYAALLDTQVHGAAKAESADACLRTLLREGLDPLPVDSLFPFEFFRDRGDAETLRAYAEARLARHPEDRALAEAYAAYRRGRPEAAGEQPEPSAPPKKITAPEPLHKRFGTIRAPLPSPYPPGTLSVVMIVKNEAGNIRAAIESFRPIADEIVVNDTGSDDGTQDLLQELGVRWFQTVWQNDFSLARNQAIDQAHCAWVLWLDADDRIPADQYENFRRLKTAPLDRAFGFQVINTQAGLPLGGRFMQMRMFPNHPRLRFRYRVHEQVLHALAEMGLHCFYTATSLHHTGYEDPELKQKKARRNLEILAREDARVAQEPSLAMSVGDSHFILGEWEQGIAAYTRAFEIPGGREINSDVYSELPACIGRGHQKLGRYSEALAWFRRSRDLQPEKIEPAYYEAECLLEMGQPEAAEKAFAAVAEMPLIFSATASQFDTVRIFSLWHGARLQAGRGAEGEAIATLRRLNQAYPQVVEAWHFLGQLLRRKGEREEAAECFARAAELNAGALEAVHRDRLDLLIELGRREEYAAALAGARAAFPAAAFATWLEAPTRSAAKKPRLSLCMIVKNEMANLPLCLADAEGLAEEVIVVDTGSGDGTDAWAEGRGATVLRTQWQHDFSRARNLSLDAASGEWILWLDADDRLRPEDKAALRALAERPADRAYGFLVQNTGDGGATGTVFHQIRLFPNRPELRFTAPVHEQILPALEKVGLPVEYRTIRILHTGYSDAAQARAKQARNRAILETQLRDGRDVTAVTHYTLAMACLDLDDPEAALRHFADARAAAARTDSNPHIAAAVPVKSAVALARLRRYAEGLRLLEQSGEETWKLPEARLVRAQLLHALNRREQARADFEALLAVESGPAFIPVDFAMLKIKALEFLGGYWHEKGRVDLAVRLLQAGLAIPKGKGFSREDLQRYYADARIPVSVVASI